MKVEKVYVQNTSINSFRPLEVAELIDVKLVTPSPKLDARLAYEIKYSDGFVDYVPLSDQDVSFRVITLNQLIKENK